jgi:DNA-binding GntR family transcriptional regulator
MNAMDLYQLPPADRIADTVYETLRDAIFAGSMQPGTRLSVPELAKTLGVSRSPVREAVLRLTQERLAQEEPRRGAAVARVGTSDLARLYEVRAVLEGLATRLAVERGGPGLVDDLEAAVVLHEEAVTAGDLAAHREADMRFHRRIRQEAENPELETLLDSIQGRVRLAMLTTAVVAGPRLALDDHRLILAAIRAGDPAAAQQAAEAHVQRLRRTLLADAQRGEAS